MQAKSRLNPEIKNSLLKNQIKVGSDSLLERYFRHSPTLIISLPFYYLIYYLFNNVFPTEIANFPIYNSYLGLLIPFFIANMLLLSYLFLNSRIGAFFSLILTIALFLKLQHFIFPYWLFIPIVIVFVIYEKLIKETKQEKRIRN